MKNYSVIKCESKAAEVIGKGTKSGNVIFTVNSESDQKAHFIAMVIKRISDIWIDEQQQQQHPTASENFGILHPSRWSSGEQLEISEGAQYVYVYALPENCQKGTLLNRTFYIGKGGQTIVNDRASSHIDVAVKQGEYTNSGKLMRIVEYVGSRKKAGDHRSGKDIGADLVRKIAWFSGEYATETAHAVENFLIDYWAGIYGLENQRAGDRRRRSECESAEWIVRRRYVSGKNETWSALLRDFEAYGVKAITQARKNMLLKAEIEGVLLGDLKLTARLKALFPITSGVVSILAPDPFVVQANASDISLDCPIEIKGMRIARIQLKLSDREPGACLNLRKSTAGRDAFMKFIGQAFPGGQIRNQGTDPYFKVVANNIEGRTQDIFFSVVDPIGKKFEVCGLPWLNYVEKESVSLKEILERIGQTIETMLIK